MSSNDEMYYLPPSLSPTPTPFSGFFFFSSLVLLFLLL